MAEKNYKIALFGLGYIGLPTAALFAKNGFKLIGVDINQKIVDSINAGHSSILEPGLDELVKEGVTKKLLSASTDGIKAAKESNVMIIVVPTPVDPNNCSDLTAVISACETISHGLNRGDLVIIESTVPPYTCERTVIPILEQSGLKASVDFGVAYTPERALPNNTLYEMTHNARVIGGIDKESAEKAAFLYSKITQGEVITVENLVTAEMIKLMENTYRDTNISLANELAMVCESLGIDAIEAIKAANFHPRVNILSPGPGVGGHCLSVDPYFIIEMAEKQGIEARLIKTARDINNHMPHHVAQMVENSLEEIGKSILYSKISILGVAYKGNTTDTRETPAKPLIKDLTSRGAEILVHDPYVSPEVIINIGAKPVEIEKALNCDCTVLITDHDQYRDLTPAMIKSPIFICTRPILDPEKFKNEGIIFKGVGRPHIYNYSLLDSNDFEDKRIILDGAEKP